MINNRYLAALHKQVFAIPSINLAINCTSRLSISIMRKLNSIQLSTDELLLITKAVQANKQCRFLVFGLGNDSIFWHHLNANGNGTILFLEDNEFWLKQVSSRIKGLNVLKVNYGTKRKDWKKLLENPDLLEMVLPNDIITNKWDIVLVDAPAGYDDETSGRMKSIYMASKLVKKGGDVFVHDCNREVEDVYSLHFLGKANLLSETKASIGNLRHFKM